MALAMKVVATTPKSCSNNMILSTKEGFAIDFECAPDESFTLYPQNGLLVHANHWDSPPHAAKYGGGSRRRQILCIGDGGSANC